MQIRSSVLAIVAIVSGCVGTGRTSQDVSCDPTLQCDPDAAPDDTCPCNVAPPTSTLVVNSTAFSSTTWHPVSSPFSMVSSTSNAALNGSLAMHTGDVVRSVAFQLRGSGILSAAVSTTDGAMNETLIGGGAFNGPASWTLFALDVTDTTLASNGALAFSFTANGSTPLQLGNVAVTYTPASP